MTGDGPVVTTAQHVIEFAGGTTGVGPLTIGQAHMVRCVLRDDPLYTALHGSLPIPRNSSLSDVYDALRELALRHESLRTVYVGGQGKMPHRQIVRGSGAFAVSLADAVGDIEPSELAERIAADRRSPRFDLAGEFPLRIVIVCRRG